MDQTALIIESKEADNTTMQKCVISTFEVVPKIKEGKHNCDLRLPYARLLTARIEKSKTYTRN